MKRTQECPRIFRVSSGAVLMLWVGLVVGSCAETAEEQASSPPASEPVKTAIAKPTTPHWDYGPEHGPEQWANLSAEFSTCGSGRKQSPIDLRKPAAGATAKLQFAYGANSLRVLHHEHTADGINNGHTIQVNFPGEDTLTVGADPYPLAQFHFHAPSEHTFEGKRYPMEMHLVHKAADGKLAVVALFIEEGAHNAAFDPIWARLPQEKGVETHYADITVDVDDFLPADRSSYQYDGSLTTPPCTEGVKWMVLATPIQLAADQIAQFTAIIHDNNRPLQPLNGREILTDVVLSQSAR